MSGVCQSCVMRNLGGRVPDSAQGELKSTLRAQGYFLSCQWQPQNDVDVVVADEATLFSPATVLNKQFLSPDVCRLRLDSSEPVFYHAGQFINLHRYDGLSRSYSLASIPNENFLELHIKRMKNGSMSNWIFDELKEGDSLDIQGPYGECFYVNEKAEQSLLLIASGTGAAPLWGIVRDALNSGHAGHIYFYHGARREAGLYLNFELKNMAAEFENFYYVPCVSGHEGAEGCHSGRANDVALAQFPDLKNWRIYICGLADMVKNTRKRAYLAGADMKQIFVDAFEVTELRKKER